MENIYRLTNGRVRSVGNAWQATLSGIWHQPSVSLQLGVKLLLSVHLYLISKYLWTDITPTDSRHSGLYISNLPGNPLLLPMKASGKREFMSVCLHRVLNTSFFHLPIGDLIIQYTIQESLHWCINARVNQSVRQSISQPINQSIGGPMNNW